MGIVVFGSVFVDIKGYPFDTYIPAGRNAGRIEEVHGGVSRNIAEDIANVELRPTFVSLVDHSGAAMGVVQKLKKHKVNTDFIEATPNGMGTWLAVFDHTGDLVAAISQRPDLLPIADIIDRRGDEIFSQADSVVIELDIEKETAKRIFKYADKYKIPVYAAVSNISIALKRRDFIRLLDCFVCNQQEAGIFFGEDYSDRKPEEMVDIIREKARTAQIPRLVVTMGEQGAVYTELGGESGFCPAIPVVVKDTSGAGDAFVSGVSIGLTYGKTLGEACSIGARLASAVICTGENVCPRFLPEEFGIKLDENGLPVRDLKLLRGPVPEYDV